MNAPMHMLPRDMQLANEHRFSKHHIDKYVRKVMQGQEFQDVIQEGVGLLETWLAGTYYESKQKRLKQLADLDLYELVEDIFCGIAYVRREELFTSVSAKLAGQLNFSDKPDAIHTMAEILAVLCETNAFDINKPSREGSLTLISNLPLPKELETYIDNVTFLPPMVCQPQPIDSNSKSGYLTHNDSLVLGKGNHHGGDLCLDVINKQNAIPLKLDFDFLCANELERNKPFESAEERDQWEKFAARSKQMFILMLNQGNRFYETHKVDKRGRLYSIGYHLNTQGSSFQKAMIELADEEIVEGV